MQQLISDSIIMIAFNFNIIFPSEPLLRDDVYNPALETIVIEQIDENTQPAAFPERSGWMDMSARKGRYFAQSKFALATGAGSQWALEIAQVLTLYWSIGSHTLHYQPEAQFTPERLRFWVCHTLLPLKFALEKRYEMLHVGAVEVAGRPIFFSAESFGGKSTLTDYFIQQGHALYSDDSLAIFQQHDTFYTVASYPFHRPYREPEVLGYPVENVARQSKPIYAGYVLEAVAADAVVSITTLEGIEKFKAFHFSGFIDLGFFKAHHFQLRAELAKAIPVYKVTIPWQIERLGEVYAKIVAHN
ncbi:hypothetical protein [Methyloprofundus sp.]|uniref:hypothetical protein n=1 Tax=Methyloprofundus sp. TaxID=2020875 RepID=UPI003D13C86C